MKIKSIKNLRWHYKTVVRKRRDPNTNTDFVGVYHDEGDKRINGLFELFHGDKKIGKFLPSLLKIAEDGQAIYEFLQNAVDCNATHFFIFYNEEYFLAVNNGVPFNHKDVLSILNIANTTKEYDCNKIGRFGIGFKLVHRLVGQNDGINELTQDYKGPVIFSWNKIDELKQLLGNSPVFPNFIKNPTDFDKEGNPWLFKILATNFPSEPGEEVWDINYKKRVLFPYTELKEVVHYLKENFRSHQGSFNFEQLDRGSLFFLKLGVGKKAHLDKDYVDLQKGVQYSMNFLKNLREVYINDYSLKKEKLTLANFEIAKGTETFESISPDYKDCNIKISFGYTDYTKAYNLRTSPNFYKYFPMGDETNGFSFIIHCDSFDIEANRRKLHESNKNKNLLPEISKRIVELAENYKTTKPKEFTTLYSNILVSKIPSKDNNKWLNESFFSVLLDYIRVNIPTTQGIQSKSENVKIKNFNLEINLADLGLENIHWFHWADEKDSFLLTEAESSEKLGIEKWNIRDVFIKADLKCFNDWVKTLSEKNYNAFLKDLDSHHFTKEAVARLLEAKIFKFSDGGFYSIQEACENNNLVFQTAKVEGIKGELTSLNFFISELDISKFSFMEKINTYLKTDEALYVEISERTSTGNELTALQKLNLFKNFINSETKFAGVADETLKQLKLFCDSQGNILSLKELLPANLNTPNWLLPFKIHSDEYDDVLKKYLLQETEIYKRLILPNWEAIIENIQEPKPFYEKVVHYFGLEEHNAPLSKQSFVFTNDGFKKSSEVFYNSRFPQNSSYSYFQSAVEKFLRMDIPSKSIFSFLKDVPFKLDNSDLNDYEIFVDTSLDYEEIKSLTAFTISNNENFFEKFYIEKSGNEYLILEKGNDVYQYYTGETNKELMQFLLDNYSESFKLLPKEFSEYKEQEGILTEHHLHSAILDFVDVDENISELIDLIKFNEPRRKLLTLLTEISIAVGKRYEVGSLEYKILDLACTEFKQKNQQEQFRKKVVLEVQNDTLKLSDIPTSNDEIAFENGMFKLSLAQILPETFKNSDFLNEVITCFSNLGIPESGLKTLFGISKEPDYENILGLIGKKIDNSQQLAFILLYHKNITNLNLAEYSVETLDGEFTLKYTYYTKQYSFIDANATLNEKYKDISKIFELPVDIDKENGTQIISEPFFTDDKFSCEYLKAELDNDQRLDLIKFIFDKWQKNKKTVIKNIDWEKINNVEAKTLLGFNPNLSVYPKEFSLKDEQLPDYLTKWISETDEAEKFISDIKVQTESSLTVSLRKFFKGNGGLQTARIAKEGSEELLFNTFLWLKENEIKLHTFETYKVFEEMVNVINKIRTNNGLKLQSEFDFERLKEESKELEEEYYTSWKKSLEDKYAICLFKGELPKTIKLDEVEDYIFREYYYEDITISEDNIIYINREKNIQKLLYGLVTQDKISSEELLQLYQTKSETNGGNEIEKLKTKVQQLEAIIENLTRVSGRDQSDITTRIDEYTNEIKERSEQFLFQYLTNEFPKSNVVWLNSDEDENFVESWDNHDFEIQDKKGNVINYIDCKGTPKSKRTFYLTQNEWEFFLNNKDNYQIYRIFNLEGTENVLVIDNLMEWIIEGKVVPYLEATETIKGGRVFLTIK
jgi:hypothetical protein